MVVVKLLYLAIWFRKHRMSLIGHIIDKVIRIVFGCEIFSTTQIGSGILLPHGGLGVVVNDNAVIGNNVKIQSCVTIGGRGGAGVPIIEDDVEIGTGAKILGGVRICRGAKIGANAVVLTDVPPYSTAVGIPARII